MEKSQFEKNVLNLPHDVADEADLITILVLKVKVNISRIGILTVQYSKYRKGRAQMGIHPTFAFSLKSE